MCECILYMLNISCAERFVQLFDCTCQRDGSCSVTGLTVQTHACDAGKHCKTYLIGYQVLSLIFRWWMVSHVDCATGWMTEESVFDTQRQRKIFPFATLSLPAVRLAFRFPWPLSLGVKRPQVKKDGATLLIPSTTFLAQCLNHLPHDTSICAYKLG